MDSNIYCIITDITTKYDMYKLFINYNMYPTHFRISKLLDQEQQKLQQNTLKMADFLQTAYMKQICDICYIPHLNAYMVTLDCNHQLCNDCIGKIGNTIYVENPFCPLDPDDSLPDSNDYESDETGGIWGFCIKCPYCRERIWRDVIHGFLIELNEREYDVISKEFII
ncbi:MAG: hypothetical protein P4L31_04880 [Candidatus Babeliales bacterium]|nr:hypothetical protein [Candidatus Babeliales bacterium]